MPAYAFGDDTPHEGEQLSRGVRVERGGRFVENDETHRLIGRREGARHFDHLAPPDRQILHQVVRGDAVTGKNLIELVDDQRSGPSTPVEPRSAG